jgi:hypothetical protein
LRLYSLEETTLFNKRWIFEAMEYFRIIKIYCSHEKYSYLPYYVLEKMFVVCYHWNFVCTWRQEIHIIRTAVKSFMALI